MWPTSSPSSASVGRAIISSSRSSRRVLERQQDREVAVDHEPRQAHRQRIGAGGDDRRLRPPPRPRADRCSARGPSAASPESAARRRWRSGSCRTADPGTGRRAPSTARTCGRRRPRPSADGARAARPGWPGDGGRSLGHEAGFDVRGNLRAGPARGSLRVAAPGVEQLLAAHRLGRRLGVVERAYESRGLLCRVRARPCASIVRRRRRCAVAFAVIVEEDGPRRDETRRTAAPIPRHARIEDYALIGDMQTAALVGRDGSIDWLCLPRFDSPRVLRRAARHAGARPLADRAGRAPCAHVARRYRDGTLVLETEFETDDGRGRASSTACRRAGASPTSCASSKGCAGKVPMRMELVIRFDYGSIVPWVRTRRRRLCARSAGPDALSLCARPSRRTARASRRWPSSRSRPATRAVRADLASRRTWPPRRRSTAVEAIDDTDAWWREWSRPLHLRGPWRDAVVRSLITLKALTYAPTGGIVAAATTSLPETLGGVRNWDYRYCWLRDATFTLYALMIGGYRRRGRAPGGTGCCGPSPGDPSTAADHVRPGRRAAADRDRACLAARLRGSRAGAGRQRRRTRSSSSTCTAR